MVQGVYNRYKGCTTGTRSTRSIEMVQQVWGYKGCFTNSIRVMNGMKAFISI